MIINDQYNTPSKLQEIFDEFRSLETQNDRILFFDNPENISKMSEFDVESYLNDITTHINVRRDTMKEIYDLTRNLEKSAVENEEQYQEQIKLLELSEENLNDLRARVEELHEIHADKKRNVEITTYYQKYYRPDLMAVIVVGDINVDQVQGYINQFFSRIEKPKNKITLPNLDVPDYNKTIYAVTTDPEQEQTYLSIASKHKRFIVKDKASYKEFLVNKLASTLFQKRLDTFDNIYFEEKDSVLNIRLVKIEDGLVKEFFEDDFNEFWDEHGTWCDDKSISAYFSMKKRGRLVTYFDGDPEFNSHPEWLAGIRHTFPVLKHTEHEAHEGCNLERADNDEEKNKKINDLYKYIDNSYQGKKWTI